MAGSIQEPEKGMHRAGFKRDFTRRVRGRDPTGRNQCVYDIARLCLQSNRFRDLSTSLVGAQPGAPSPLLKVIGTEMEARSRAVRTCLCTVALFVGLASLQAAADLKVGFYNGKCKGRSVDPERIVSLAVKKAFLADRTICASLIRLHFHDCFVQGCDGSVLLDTPDSEKNSPPNFNSLRGFQLVEDMKRSLEKCCPSLVSCADILALAARDCIGLLEGEAYAVPTGRFDGLTSGGFVGPLLGLPAPFHPIATLESIFAKVGLDKKDLVVLSGLHTVGRARCLTFSNRLYDSSGNAIQDPLFTPARAAQLRRLCPFGGDGGVFVPMDSTSATVDTKYFQGIVGRTALFTSDDALLDDPDTAAIVQRQAISPRFRFVGVGASMIKMGSIGVLLSSTGQVRLHCNQTN